MTTASLAEIATIHGGGRLGLSGTDFVASGVPAYGAAGLNGYVSVAEYDDRDAVIVSSIGARCGKCFLVKGRWTSLANTQVIMPDPATTDIRFLWYQLNDERRWHRSGSAQPFIKPADLKAHHVFLPPLPEQRRIADILDHADALRAKRRHVLAHLDALIQSIFTEMFSSVDSELMTAGSLMPYMRNGLSPAAAGTHSAQVLTLSAVTRGLFDPSAVKPGQFAVEPCADKRVTKGDFLMCRGNGNRALVGIGTYPRESRPDLVFPDTVIAGTVDTRLVTMPFLETVWKNAAVRSQIESAARTTNGTYKVNQQTLSAVLVPVPPLRVQEAFSVRVTHVVRHREVAQTGGAVSDQLFASLRFRAFRGEL